MNRIICSLKVLNCYRSSELTGDEVFLTFLGRKIWPDKSKYIKCNDESSIPLNIVLPEIPSKGNTIKIELWDVDLITNDLLGEFIFAIGNDIGQFRADLRSTQSRREHRYSIDYAMQRAARNAHDF